MTSYYRLWRLVELEGKLKWVCIEDCEADYPTLIDERVTRTSIVLGESTIECVTCGNDLKDCRCLYDAEDDWGEQGLVLSCNLVQGQSTIVPLFCLDYRAPRTKLVGEVAKAAGLMDITDDPRWAEWLSHFKSAPSIYRLSDGRIVRVLTLARGRVVAEVYAEDEAALLVKLRRISFGRVEREVKS